MDPDPKHVHFISILQKVRKILQEASRELSQARQEEFRDPKHVLLANRFSLLELSETSHESTRSESSKATSSERESKTPTTPVNRKYEVESPRDDAKVALFCYFQDMKRLRATVAGYWSEYRSGLLDLNSDRIDSHGCRTYPAEH
ncbi:MAG: hypothetical protein MMC23_002322 [Stictis urceolatum]|nr:hypothetical protein [Stictis urceolata]